MKSAAARLWQLRDRHVLVGYAGAEISVGELREIARSIGLEEETQ